jgi:hypothetical protein
MQPTNVILDAMVNLLAADPATLAPAALANHVHLSMTPFTPGPTLDIAGVTDATFNTYVPANAGVGTQQEFIDPMTGLRNIQLLEPAGGWHWETGSAANLPQTIYGWFVTDNADAVMLGSALFSTPIVLTAAGQAVDIGNIRLTFAPSSPY